ncbi:MAG: ABC transporter ATP-binding protein [Eubacteriales bacterium]|nr:ABC transporter ATP-binding protein [Eubacteriales bacterium]
MAHGPARGVAKPRNTMKTFRRLFGYLWHYPVQLIIIVLSLLFSSGAAVLGTYMLKPLFNSIAALFNAGASSMLPILSQVLTLALIYVLGALGTFLSNRLILNVSTDILERVRCEMFTNLQKLPLRYFDTRTHGEIMSLFSNDTDTLREMLSQGIPQLITSLITVVGVIAMMLLLSPVLTLIVLIMFVLMLVLIKRIGSKSSRYFKLRQEALAKTNGYIEEMIEGQREVKVFCHEDAVRDEFSVLSENLRSASTSAMTFAMILMPIMGNLSYVLYAASAAIGAGMTIAGLMDIGTIAAFLQYTRQFTNPLTQIAQQFNGILNALAGAERIFDLIDETPETDDGKVTLTCAKKHADGSLEACEEYTGVWAWRCPQANGSNKLVELLGDVRFEDVTFAYEEGHDVLKHITLYAKPGQKIAFVGSTGAGKTTITNLINRFYDVQQGRITYDGIDVKDIRKDDLRRSLSMVLQDTHLFTGTVRENIRYGNLNATDAEIERAAKLANADFFIRHLPQGYDTVLTADGVNLSQGQRQLLSIARAAAENAPVLILDEATSSIDTRTERLIEQGMDQLMAGRTVFVIAHRLSTVRNADAIMVLEHGEIIERGDHDDLLTQKGKYYQLYMGMFELS